ncbi:hypothetical protein [Oceanicaulis alexandrii]|uniref:hypothetical protein n=1 Tax=Oceanicaulis alexandrii TaxID=153233 RepID=UPI0003B31F94|nr:hypothetical protein [Oceanicaulis alexandrii]
MTTETKKNYPAYRLCFAPYTGTERNGRQEIGFPVEIGAAWPRDDESKGLILRLNLVPDDLRSGLILLKPVEAEISEQSGLPLEEVA